MKIMLSLAVFALIVVPAAAISPAFSNNFSAILSDKSEAYPVDTWTPEDEGDHFPCGREWWNVDTFFVIDGMGNWSLTSSFEYEMETPACNLFLTVFNMDNGTSYSLGSYGDPVGTLTYEKNMVKLRYQNSWMEGLYPEYVVHFERKNFIINLHFEAATPPQWVAGNISNGILPMGSGYYKYGFIPFCRVTGNITVDGKYGELRGTGYYEHVWGNWTYSNPFRNPSDLRGIYTAYKNLTKWWLSHHSLSIPSSIAFSSDNNIFGYDWIWASFDNNWSMFYGNVPSWVCQGPAFGILYLVSDEGEYLSFSNISYEYGSMVYVADYDVYYPSEIKIKACAGDKKLELDAGMTCDIHTYLDRNLSSRYWKAIFLWESPGYISGFYSDGNENVSLNGKCEIEPERQVPAIGHNYLGLNFTTPPDGIAIGISIISHFFGIGIDILFQISPAIKFHFVINSLS